MIATAPGDAEIEGVARFLQAEGERHQAVERRVTVGPLPLAELIESGPRPRSTSAP